MGWAWLLLTVATYPWLLAADLASDTVASSSLVVFISGVCLVAPCRRLRRWQAVLLAAGIGFLFEARRPVPDGALALTLVTVAIFLTSQRSLLRHTPGMLRAAVIVNMLGCLSWFLAAAAVAPVTEADTLWLGIVQVGLAGLAGLLIFLPLALTQNAVMDRLGVPPPPTTNS